MCLTHPIDEPIPQHSPVLFLKLSSALKNPPDFSLSRVDFSVSFLLQ